MQPVRHGEAIHARASQLATCAVSGRTVMTTLYVVSVAGGCFTPHCNHRQRFDIAVYLTTVSCRQNYSVSTKNKESQLHLA